MKMTYATSDDIRSQDGDETVKWLIEQMEDGDVFIDAGAHIGWIAVPVLMATNPSLAILIEPSYYAAKLLKKNLEDNGIKNFVILRKLLTDKVGKDTYRGKDNSAHGSMFHGDNPVTRPTVSVDSLVEEYKIDKPIVMKMDIELAEPLAWAGMNECIPLVKAVNMEYRKSKIEEHTDANPSEFISSIQRKGFIIAPVNGLHRDGYKWDLCLTKK